jgi:hypothetical protein
MMEEGWEMWELGDVFIPRWESEEVNDGASEVNRKVR